MSGIEEARRKIEERRQQQASSGGSGHDLWMRKDDICIAHPLFTGEEGDPYFEVYQAHEFPAKGQGQWPTLVYCPVESGHDQNYDCQGCREGVKIKDRMIMWFWVYDILHASLKDGESFPITNFNNRNYYQRTINAPRLWDTSAWRESPLDDIFMLAAQVGNLHNTMVNILCTGENITRRYKIYMQPNSTELTDSEFEQAKGQIQPVIEILQNKLVSVPVQANPQAAPAEQAAVYKPAGAVAAYTPKGGGGAPTYTPPGKKAEPKASPKTSGKSAKTMF